MKTLATQRACWEAGCDRRQHARGYCQRHYQLLRRQGELESLPKVSAARAGVECYVCGRPLRVHGLTEFCDLIDRRMGL
jgi:hypothetical protein